MTCIEPEAREPPAGLDGETPNVQEVRNLGPEGMIRMSVLKIQVF